MTKTTRTERLAEHDRQRRRAAYLRGIESVLRPWTAPRVELPEVTPPLRFDGIDVRPGGVAAELRGDWATVQQSLLAAIIAAGYERFTDADTGSALGGGSMRRTTTTTCPGRYDVDVAVYRSHAEVEPIRGPVVLPSGLGRVNVG